MKHLLLPLGFVLLLFPAALFMLFVYEAGICRRETEEALKDAETETLRMLTEIPYREIETEEQLTDVFLAFLLPRLRDGDVTVRIYGREMHYGLLDAEVTLTRPFPLFGPLSVTVRRTAVADTASAYGP